MTGRKPADALPLEEPVPWKRPSPIQHQLWELVEREDEFRFGNGKANVKKLQQATGINYAKLRALLEGDDKPLSWSELWRLEALLRAHRLGILREESLFDQLADGETAFLLPSYNTGFRLDVVPQDIDAMNCLQQQIDKRQTGRAGSCRRRYLPRKMTESEFKEFRARELSDCHCIVIGSPRAFQPARSMLDEIVPVIEPPPFQFVWAPEPKWTHGLGRFAANVSALAQANPGKSIFQDMLGPSDGSGQWDARKAPRALILSWEPSLPKSLPDARVERLADDRFLLPVYRCWTSESPHEWTSYGIVAASWIGDHLCIVVAGLGAAETYAASSLLDELRVILWYADRKDVAAWSAVAVPMRIESDQPEPDLSHAVSITGPQLCRRPDGSEAGTP